MQVKSEGEGAQSFPTLSDPMDCSPPAIRVVLSAYLRLLIFLPEILILACASSRPAFLMMFSAYKLNKQVDTIQPWCTPFPIWNQSVVTCPVPWTEELGGLQSMGSLRVGND